MFYGPSRILDVLTRFMTPFSDKRNRRSQCMTW